MDDDSEFSVERQHNPIEIVCILNKKNCFTMKTLMNVKKTPCEYAMKTKDKLTKNNDKYLRNVRQNIKIKYIL